MTCECCGLPEALCECLGPLDEAPCLHLDVREAFHHALAGRGTHTCLDCGEILTLDT